MIEKKKIKINMSVTLVLIVLNAIMFLITEMTGPSYSSKHLIEMGALTNLKVNQGEYWRFISSMFLHSGMRHLTNNMLSLYVIGLMLEKRVGSLKFAIIYLISGIGGNIGEYLLHERAGSTVVAVGASGAVFGVMGALLWVLIKHKGRIPGMDLRRMLIYVALSVYMGLAGANIANGAHIAGLIVGFIITTVLYRKEEKVEKLEAFERS